MSSSMRLEISKRDSVTVIAPGPEYQNLDEKRLENLTDVLLEVSQTADAPLVVIDLSHAFFFGTLFLAILFWV